MDITSALYILIWPRVVVEMWGKCMNFDGDAFVFLVWPSASILNLLRIVDLRMLEQFVMPA
jgi:hypothetical protein